MRSFMNVARALSDENRVRVLLMLRGGELCVCQIMATLGLAPSTVSKHMSILKQAQLVSCRKQGRWVYYRLPMEGEAPQEVRSALQWVFGVLADDPCILGDSQKVKVVCEVKPEELCRQRTQS